MLFGKRRRNIGPQTQRPESRRESENRPELYLIDFEMMVKGSFHKRRNGTVRQFGVTVRGATHMVTSGDLVDQETYDALRAMGAIVEKPAATPDHPFTGSPEALSENEYDTTRESTEDNRPAADEPGRPAV